MKNAPRRGESLILVVPKCQKNMKIGVRPGENVPKKKIGVPARLHLEFHKKKAKFVSGPPPGSSEINFGKKEVKFQSA